MEFPNPEINAYLKELTPPTSDLMTELETMAAEQDFPIIGPLVGRLLYQWVKVSQTKTVFELGSGYGYSALWIAMALPEGGQIICTEYDKAKAEMGMKYLDRAKQRHKVIYEVGNALDNFHRYQGPFDLIFCDIDKQEYPKALDMALPKLRSGGLFIADNVLWSGRILDPDDRSKETEGIRKFNEKIFRSPELVSSMIPLRDGVSVSLKR